MTGKRKNVLLIAMDDAFAYWRFRSVFGAELKTPNLDRICDVSTAFHAAYCQVPVCGPSRASAMSGLSPFHTHVFDNYGKIFDAIRPEQMWQYRLKQDGYHCATAGKIHHGYKPLPADVHDALYSHPSARVYFGPARDAPANKYGGLLGGLGTILPNDDRKYYDYRSAQHAVRFFESYDGTAPFYREVGFHHPHPPFRTPDRFKAMYDLDSFIQPAEWTQGFDLSAFTSVFMHENMETAEAVDTWQRSIRNYFSAFSHVDEHIGRVWDALKASPHAENTVVVIFSDHGYHMGDKNRFRKFTLWEEATRVPLIVHDPDQPARVVESPVALVDLGPTVLDYADAPPMQSAVGRSLRPLVEGDQDADRAVPTFVYGSVSIRKNRHRLTLYQDGTSEFHDVIDDPWLTRNLTETAEGYSGMREHLLEVCAAYGVRVLADEEKDPSFASDYATVFETAAPGPSDLPGHGVMTTGSLPAGLRQPGYRRQHTILTGDNTISLPDSIRELRYAADANSGFEHLRVKCNDLGNRIVIKGGFRRFLLEVDGGDGGDRITVSHETLVARLGRGKNRVKSGVSGATIHCSSGKDTIYLSLGENTVEGGSGRLKVHCTEGEDTIRVRGGTAVVNVGSGKTVIELLGGQSTIRIPPQATDVALRIMRTALPQTIVGYRGGSLELSDLARGNSVQWIARDDGVALVTGLECCIFRDVDEAALRSELAAVLDAEPADTLEGKVEAVALDRAAEGVK